MDRDERRSWGPLVKAARVALGLTQDDVAEQAGTTRRTLGSIERGDSVAQHDVLDRLLGVLGLTPVALDQDVETFLAMIGPLLQMLTAEQRLAVMPEVTQLVARNLSGNEATVTQLRPTRPAAQAPATRASRRRTDGTD